MAQLASKLSEILHWPLVDQTGEARKFDLKLDWKTVGADDNPFPEEGTSSFAALQEQLGLKLEFGKIIVEVIVIDSAEKPSSN